MSCCFSEVPSLGEKQNGTNKNSSLSFFCMAFRGTLLLPRYGPQTKHRRAPTQKCTLYKLFLFFHSALCFWISVPRSVFPHLHRQFISSSGSQVLQGARRCICRALLAFFRRCLLLPLDSLPTKRNRAPAKKLQLSASRFLQTRVPFNTQLISNSGPNPAFYELAPTNPQTSASKTNVLYIVFHPMQRYLRGLTGLTLYISYNILLYSNRQIYHG